MARALCALASLFLLAGCSLVASFDRSKIPPDGGPVADGGPGDADGGPDAGPVDGEVPGDGGGDGGPPPDGPIPDGGPTDGGSSDGGPMCPDLTGDYDGTVAGPGCDDAVDGVVAIDQTACDIDLSSTMTVSGMVTIDDMGEFTGEMLTVGTMPATGCDAAYAPGPGRLTITCGTGATECVITLLPM